MSLKKMKKIQKEKQTPKTEILGFDEMGRPIKAKKKIKKAPIIVFSSIAAVLGFVYIPAMIKTPSIPAFDTSKTTLNTDMIRTGGTYYKTYPDADFDKDGLTNSVETQYGTNGFYRDTDDDGLSDYAEIYILNTSPTRWNNDLQKYVAEIDEKNGNATGTPYKLNNVVLWADDLASKSYGGVVKTFDGYEFSDFSGWVQFAEEGHAYAYDSKNKIHKKLPYRAEENAYYVSGHTKVVIYPEEIPTIYKGEFFGEIVYFEDDFWGQLLDFLLPDYGNYGFLKCYPVLECDKVGVDRPNYTIDIVEPNCELKDERFAKNCTSLEELAKVYTSINSNKTVYASLFKENYGETLLIVYGYTCDGDLLVADAVTKEPIGKLLIFERAGRMLDENGIVNMENWFEFSCTAYYTFNYSRLSFVFDDEAPESGPFVPDNSSTDTTDAEGTETTAPAETTSPIEDVPETTESTEASTTEPVTESTEETTSTPSEENTATETTPETAEPGNEETTTSVPTTEEPTTTAATTEAVTTAATTTTTAATTTAATTTPETTTTEDTIFDFSNF